MLGTNFCFLLITDLKQLVISELQNTFSRDHKKKLSCYLYDINNL